MVDPMDIVWDDRVDHAVDHTVDQNGVLDAVDQLQNMWFIKSEKIEKLIHSVFRLTTRRLLRCSAVAKPRVSFSWKVAAFGTCYRK